MLRLTTLVLILANAGFFAWHAGWLDAGAAGRGDTQRSPERARPQVNPAQLIVLNSGSQTRPTPSASAASQPADQVTASAASAIAASASQGAASGPSSVTAEVVSPSDTNGQCVEAGPFTQDEQRQANAMLGRILKAGQWGVQSVAVPGLWLVYMGPYPDDESLERKEAELRRIRNLPFEEVRSPATLARGLSLGKFTEERQANAALETLRVRGIRTARVVNARPAMELQVLRASAVDLNQKAQLQKLPLPAGKGFIDCNG
jgi:hypothetical protein